MTTDTPSGTVLPYILFVFELFVILVTSRFGFEGWSWLLIASVLHGWVHINELPRLGMRELIYLLLFT